MTASKILVPLLAASVLLAAPLSADIVRNAPPLPVLKPGGWDSLKLTRINAEAEENHWGNPIGNGYIGAKIKGGVETDLLQLNDKTFWSGGPSSAQDPKRKTALQETRKKLAAGDIKGANDAARGRWGPVQPGTYLPIGTLVMDFANTKGYTNYSRELDLDRAVSTVKYRVGTVDYTREAFASFPDRVIVLRLSASASGKVSFSARLKWPEDMNGHAKVSTEGTDTLIMQGKAPQFKLDDFDEKKGMTYQTRVQVKAQGGRVTIQNSSVRVEGADSAVLIIADVTSYNGYLNEPGTEGVDPAPRVKYLIAQASAKTYDQLLAAHLQDYQALFRRLWTEINGEKPNKYALGLQYARYDMIAASRVGDRPHNQQGMWNNDWKPMSNCCHFLNENVEKYYSPIEAANTADCGEPLWTWMAELAQNGAITAKIDWGFHGWLAPHYSDIWATTTLKSFNNEATIWPMGGIWLCQNLWDHYTFSLDENFLRTRAYPLMKGAAEFALDLLVDDGKGHLVTSPSTSPENQFRLVPGGPTYAVSQGSTMDMGLIRALFAHCIEATKTLKIDADFRAKLTAAYAKLLPFQISKRYNGELQEWSQDFLKRSDDDHHRHASHLITVWPLDVINEKTPELFAAAAFSLDERKGGGYHPDKGAMYARLHEGDKALAAKDNFYTGGGLAGQFPPKYSAYPEMLLQSHNRDERGAYEIELLPALPADWKSGLVNGLRARGGYEVSLEWSDGKLKKCRIDSRFGTTPVIRYEGKPLNPAADSRLTLNLITPAPAPAP